MTQTKLPPKNPARFKACLVRHSPGVVLVHRLNAWLKALSSE